MACNSDTCIYIAQHFEGNTDTKFQFKNINNKIHVYFKFDCDGSICAH